MKKYILDTNIYINFYERYYNIDYFPSFWQNISPILNKHVIVPEIIISENYQDKWFRDWLETNYREDIINHKLYASDWTKVLQHVSLSNMYRNEALTSDKGWAKESIADPWIIAIALAENYTIVTNERKNNGLNSKNPSKSVKIPDICQDLNVKCIDMLGFFKDVNLSV